MGDTLMTTKVSDREIRAIAKLELPLPESAKRAGMSRTNFRNRAQKLGLDVKLGASGRPRLFNGCGIPGCAARYYSNGRCRQHFFEWYYQQNSGKAKDRARKQREVSRSYVSREELERLRRPENLRESLCYGTEKKIVHLACGWIGDDLTHHIRHFPVKAESWNSYSEYWGFDRSTTPVSPMQRRAYSQRQQGIWTFERRSNMARTRWGKGTDPRFQTRKISNSKILEIVAYNPGLSVPEYAALAGMSPVGFYKRAKQLGDFRTLVPAPRPQRECVRLASDAQLRRWIASLPQNFPAEQFMQFCMDNLDHGPLIRSQFALFILHLEKELRERQEWIAEIAAEIAGHKPARSAMRLGNRVFERVRAALKDSNAQRSKPAFVGTRRKHGPDKTPAEQTVWFSEGRKVEELIPSIGQAKARHKVAETSHRQYSTIEQYHKRYRRWLQHQTRNKVPSETSFRPE
jgi:hypothetical protein